MGNEKDKKKKFRIEKHELEQHEILPLLKGEDISNIEYIDVEILNSAIVMNIKYIKNVIEEEKKNREKYRKENNIPIDMPIIDMPIIDMPIIDMPIIDMPINSAVMIKADGSERRSK